MRNIEPQWPAPEWDERQELDFIDYVLLPLCFALLLAVCVVAIPLNLWDWFRRR